MRFFLLLLALLGLSAAVPADQSRPIPGMVRVRLVTSQGAIVVALDARRAPKTVANFLAYVDDQRLDGTSFYRAARNKADATRGFIQGGIGTDARRMLDRLPLESTAQTGLRHLDGTISMAHGPDVDGANCNFSIMVGPNPGLDAKPGYRGFAAFGHVVQGMDVVKRILAMRTGGGRGVMRGQMLIPPVTLIRAERLDGRPRPTGQPRTWLLFGKR
ncbi:MAG: peptidylprolyl isomerase [Pseudomonadota bacterium]